MQIDTAISTIIGATVGATFSVIGVAINTLIIRKSEERKHLRDLAVTSAIKNWEQMHVDAKMAAAAGYEVTKSPIDSYLVHMFMLINAVAKPDMNEQQLEKELKRINKMIDVVSRHTRKAPESMGKNPADNQPLK